MAGTEAALAALEIARGGRGGAWFVSGPAGSGKTWLLEQLTASVGDREIRWLHAARNTDANAGTFGAALEPRIVDAPTETELAESLRGTLLLADDVNQLDDGHIEVLGRLASRAERLDLLIVVSERSGTGRPATAKVATSCSAVTLGPLDLLRPTMRDLVSALDPDDAERVHRESRGWYELVAAHPALGDDNIEGLLLPRMAALSDPARLLATRLAFGASLDDGSAENAVGATGGDLDHLLVELEAGGLTHAGAMAPAVTSGLRQVTPIGARRQALQAALKDGTAASRRELADWLATTSDRSPEAMAVLVASAADRVPIEAVTLLALAVSAGAPPPAAELLVRAHTRAGQPGEALAEAIAAGVGGAPLRTALARVGRMTDAHAVHGDDDLQAAAVAAAIGDCATAARLIEGSAVTAVGPQAAAAALVRATSGLVNGDDHGLAARDAARLVDDGVDTSDWVLDPRCCAAIATSLALEGEPPTLDSPPHAFSQLGRVVRSWVDLRAGRTAQTAAPDGSELGPLDLALGAVIDAAASLRADRLDVLTTEVQRAARALEGVQLDAWHVPLVLEILAPAARAGVSVARLTDACDSLVRVCDQRSLLTLAYAVAKLMAAVSADDAGAVALAAQAFDDLRGDTPAHIVFGQTVPVLAAVYSGTVELDAVLAAAAALRDVGLVFEASRLTSAAALRSTNEDDAKALLRESRAMRQERRSVGRGGDVTELSDREVEVARLIVQGQTHKEVGATLFISAKTVEHHAARIRTKLGASGRAEMMSAIRDYLDATTNIDA